MRVVVAAAGRQPGLNEESARPLPPLPQFRARRGANARRESQMGFLGHTYSRFARAVAISGAVPGRPGRGVVFQGAQRRDKIRRLTQYKAQCRPESRPQRGTCSTRASASRADKRIPKE